MSDFITTPCHGPGYTCLAFSGDGTYAFTGGDDGVVRIWKTNEGAEQEPESTYDAGGAVTSLAATDGFWLSGCVDAIVRRYIGHGDDLSDHVTQTGALPVRCIAIDPKGKRVAVTSDDLSVKIVDLEDTMQTTQLTGQKSGIRRATWHPNGDYLTICTMDGTLTVWNLTEAEPRIEANIPGIIPAVVDSQSTEFAHDCSAIWSPEGENIYVASKTHDLSIISRSTWSKTATISDRNVNGVITALAVSSAGTYVATASQSKVYIWSTQTRKIVAKHDTPGGIIHQLAFSPKDNLLAWTDSEGAFNRWIKPVPSTLAPPTTGKISALAPARPLASREEKDRYVAMFNDVPDAVNDAVMDLDDDDAMADFILDDMGGEGFKDGVAEERQEKGYIKEMVSITKAQPSFQPGSSPMMNRKRYLAFNMLGTIDASDQDTHHVVNVEFFDKSARKAFHFVDHHKYDMGYLGERGALFACPAEGEHPSQVHYRPYFSSFSTTVPSEWTYLLRPSTLVLGIACGGVSSSLNMKNASSATKDLDGYGEIVIATSEGDLTFLSGTGRERMVMGFGAEFVSMVASAEWVFVVHRKGGTTIDGSQNLSYSLIMFDDLSIVQKDTLPIGKGHTLKWVGVTEQGAPAIYDSNDHLHILSRFRVPHSATWTRILDTNLLERKQGKDETYWPVGVTENNLMAIILKGRQLYPGFPKPLMQELPLRIPFRKNEPKEELIARELLVIQESYDALVASPELTSASALTHSRLLDREIIQLIQIACKSDHIPRAFELVKLISSQAALDSAIKIADFYRLHGFKEKIEFLKEEREEEEDRVRREMDKRRKWMRPKSGGRILGLLPADRVHTNGGIQQQYHGQKIDPLNDPRPPPQIERPGMARVKLPVVEPTRFKAQGTDSALLAYGQHQQQQQRPVAAAALAEEESSEADWLDVSISSSSFPVFGNGSGEGKRKRSDEDDEDSLMMGPPSSFLDGRYVAAPIPKKTANPFARKPAAPADTNRNPFARKLENKVIAKSDSFFDKVERAEDSGPAAPAANKKGKSKAKPDAIGPRQTTLFGMVPGAAAKDTTTNSGGSKKGLKLREQVRAGSEEVETQTVETQDSGDVAMLDAAASGKSQSPGDSQRSKSGPGSDWVETQLVDGEEDPRISSVGVEETQLVE